MSAGPEFSRPHRLDQIGAGEAKASISAQPEERAALAGRFDLISVESLEADLSLRRDLAGIVAKGRVRAEVVQRCVVTDEPVPASIDEEFTIRFVPEPADSADEVELSEEEGDTVFYSGGVIDLGEAAAETMALALDPFPRSPRAAEVLQAAGVVDEDAVPPAGKLGGMAGLKDLIDRR